MSANADEYPILHGELIEADRKERGRQRRWRIAIRLAVYMTVPLGVLVLANLPRMLASGDAAVQQASAAGTDTAERAVRLWLGPVGGVITSQIGFTVEHVPESKDGNAVVPAFDRESHLFGVSVGDAPYRASVTVDVALDGAVTVEKSPTLMPSTEGDGVTASGDDDWGAGAVTAPAPEGLDVVLESWLKAYASGDAEQLRAVVGDGSTDHTYAPLVGWTADRAGVESCAQINGSSTIACRIHYNASPVSSPTTGLSVLLDIRVEKADTAVPQITAWGPPGSGRGLTRFSNAIRTERRPVAQSTTTTSTTLAADRSPDTTSTAAPTSLPPQTAPPEPPADACDPAAGGDLSGNPNDGICAAPVDPNATAPQ